MKILSIIMFIFINNNQVFAQSDLIFKSSFSFVARLNDTGITWASNDPFGNNSSCFSDIPGPQDCNSGRDVTDSSNSDGHAGFSFTKLDSNGNVLSANANSWICVKDNITGLIWEVKTNDNGIHDKDDTYTWGGLTAIGREHPNSEGPYSDDWNALVQSAITNSFCGLNNWRVPKISELTTISNKGRYDPAIDTDYFPNTKSSGYWTTSPVADNNQGAWVVDFYSGQRARDVRVSGSHIRLVTSGE